MDLGKPDEDLKIKKEIFEFVYNTKKYGIPCERRFEINSEVSCSRICFKWLFLNNTCEDKYPRK